MMTERTERQHYLNVGETKSPHWAPVGVGFSKFTEEKNATAFHRRFYHEADERTFNDGYSTSISYEFDLYSSSLAAEKLREICDGELSGDSGKVEVLCVDYFRPADTPDTYYATKRKYSAVPEDCGEGSDSLRYTGKLWADGEIIHGIYVSSTGTFLTGKEKEEIGFE